MKKTAITLFILTIFTSCSKSFTPSEIESINKNIGSYRIITIEGSDKPLYPVPKIIKEMKLSLAEEKELAQWSFVLKEGGLTAETQKFEVELDYVIDSDIFAIDLPNKFNKQEEQNLTRSYFANEKSINDKKEELIAEHAFSNVCVREGFVLGCAEYKKKKKKNHDELVSEINGFFSKKTSLQKGSSLKSEKVLVVLNKLKKGSEEEIKASVRAIK